MVTFTGGSISGLSSMSQSEEWTLIVIPDTQRLAANNASAYNALIQWIVDNKETEDIRMVIHLGDYVNAGGNSTQWGIAATAMDRLHTNTIPWIHCVGNWDYDGGNTDVNRTTTSYWEAKFPASDWNGKTWYVDDYNNVTTNQAATLTIAGKKYLFLTLEIWPRDAVLTWARGIITAQSPDRIILATHGLMRPDGTYEPFTGDGEGGGQGNGPDDYSFCGDCNSGQDVYDDFISDYSEMILVMNGHEVSSSGTVNGVNGQSAFKRKVETIGGNPVNINLFNYQNVSGNNYADSAYLRIYRFNEGSDQATVTTYNPVQDTFLTDSENQFTISYN